MIREKVLFTPEECKAILDLSGEFSDGHLIRNYGAAGEKSHQLKDSSFRVTELSSPVDSNALSNVVLPKLKEFNIKSLPSDCNFLKYNIGGKINPHRDRNPEMPETIDRVYTLIIQLTDNSEYTGGNLFVGEEKANSMQGNVIVFNSNLIHNVTPVKTGTRYAFLAWLRDYNLKIEKSAI